MTGDVSALGLVLSLLLVAVAMVLSVAQRLGLEGPMAWASLRALVQLLVIGAGLALVIDPNTPLAWSWLWIVGMVVFASFTVGRRERSVPGIQMIALGAFGAAAVVTLGVLFGLRVFPLEARTLVPLAGMMVGNSMTATVVVANRIVEEFKDKRDEIEARLALGQSSTQAGLPYVRRALRTAVTPHIERTKAVGIVFLPGAMTGLILAGVDPVDAVMVQAVVMYLILGAMSTTTAVVALSARRRLFTSDHRLVRLSVEAD